MKSNHYWALLKQETSFIVIRFAIPLTFGIQMWFFAEAARVSNSTFHLILLMILGPVSILWAYGFAFQNGGFGLKRPDQGYGRTIEFPFSQAICRNSFYWAKLTWFGFTAMIPFLSFGLYSLLHPDRTVFFDRDLPGGDATRAFYLGHFPGARALGSGRLSSLMLPYARAEMALSLLFLGLVVVATYQAALLGTLRFRWSQWLIPIIFWLTSITAPIAFMLYSVHRTMWDPGNHPLSLDQALGWTIQHSMPLFLGGIFIIGFALWFGCRRFARQEVLS